VDYSIDCVIVPDDPFDFVFVEITVMATEARLLMSMQSSSKPYGLDNIAQLFQRTSELALSLLSLLLGYKHK